MHVPRGGIQTVITASAVEVQNQCACRNVLLSYQQSPEEWLSIAHFR